LSHLFSCLQGRLQSPLWNHPWSRQYSHQRLLRHLLQGRLRALLQGLLQDLGLMLLAGRLLRLRAVVEALVVAAPAAAKVAVLAQARVLAPASLPRNSNRSSKGFLACSPCSASACSGSIS
jgi:hypothetical protein